MDPYQGWGQGKISAGLDLEGYKYSVIGNKDNGYFRKL